MAEKKVDLKNTKVLFLAYFYPPVNSQEIPGAMRTLKFIRNLMNGECHVLTTYPKTSPSESALTHIQPPINAEHIHQVKSWDLFQCLLAIRSLIKEGIGKLFGGSQHAPRGNQSTPETVFKGMADDTEKPISSLQKIKDFAHNLCYFPDQAGPWLLPAYLRGVKVVRENAINYLFATGSPWTSLWAGYLISKKTGTPLIADFRDPWMNNPFHQSKGKLLDKWSKKLEQKIVEHATAITLNTEPLKADFLSRYPHIPEKRFSVLPNGFDESDFNALSSHTKADAETSWITLTHAGFLYGVRDPSVLLNAIKKANQSSDSTTKKIRFRQIGDISLNFDIKTKYADMLEDGSFVLDPPRPYMDCLKALSDSDWLVNIQPETKTQVPSKLYDYLALNKPILNITPKSGALGTLVQQNNLGKLFGFEEEEALHAALIEIANTGEQENFSGYAARSLFDCAIITQSLVNIMHEQSSKS